MKIFVSKLSSEPLIECCVAPSGFFVGPNPDKENKDADKVDLDDESGLKVEHHRVIPIVRRLLYLMPHLAKFTLQIIPLLLFQVFH